MISARNFFKFYFSSVQASSSPSKKHSHCEEWLLPESLLESGSEFDDFASAAAPDPSSPPGVKESLPAEPQAELVLYPPETARFPLLSWLL